MSAQQGYLLVVDDVPDILELLDAMQQLISQIRELLENKNKPE